MDSSKIQTLFVQPREDPEADALLERIRKTGYQVDGLRIERVFRIEGDVHLSDLMPLFHNPIVDDISEQSGFDESRGPIIEIGYQKAVTDPETPSIFDAAEAMGISGLEWVRLYRRYQLIGVTDEEAPRVAQAVLYNPVVETIIQPGEVWDSLHPHGVPAPLETISLLGLSEIELIDLSLGRRWNAPLEQMKVIQDHELAIGRPHTKAEIEMNVQWWCDHCYHTTWKSLGLLKILMEATASINHSLVVSAFDQNAGGFEFYDGWVVLIKGETHCHPSAIFTYGGIMTKHGGILRDIMMFGKGGYPIGGTTIMGIMDPRMEEAEVPFGALHPRRILAESIRGTADYLNPMGIPMMQAMYRAHPRYPKCFVLGHSIGMIPKKYALQDQPQKDDLIFLIGGRTGRDGIHGATGSSGSLSDEVVTRFAAEVQIGHPIVERKPMTAIPVLRDSGCIRTDTDLGAGGISCAVGEIAKGYGAYIDISTVHLKDNSLSDDEIMVSESQERFLLIVPVEKKDEVIAILKLYDVEYSILGYITGDNTLTVVNKDRLVAQFDLDYVWNKCPIPSAEIAEPKRVLAPIAKSPPCNAIELKDTILQIMSHFHVCSQSEAVFQFDQTVQGRTVIGPLSGIHGDMPVNAPLLAPLRNKPYGLGLGTGWKPFYGEIDPAQMVRLAVIEAISYGVATGASISDMALNSNYYTPKMTPEIAWDLKAMVHAQAEINVQTGVPTICGKDSSSGTYLTKDGQRIDVPYTCVIANMFRMPDVRRAVTKPFKKPGNTIVWLGPCQPEALGGSVYLDCFGERGDVLPTPDIDLLLAIYLRLHKIYYQDQNPIVAAAAFGDGGLIARIFEMSYGSGFGASLNLNGLGNDRYDGYLFGEAIGSLILEVDKTEDPELLFNGLSYCVIGKVVKEPVIQVDSVSLTVSEIAQVWHKTFKEVI